MVDVVQLVLGWIHIVAVVVWIGLARAGSVGALNAGVLMGTSYGSMLLAKMSLFTVMFIIGLVITRIGIKLSRGATPEYASRAQRQIKLLSETNILLGVTAILLAVSMRVGS